MSYYFHPNQLQGLLAEHEDYEDYEDNVDMRSISRALRFLEGLDYEDEPLRLRRGRRAQQTFKDLSYSTAH